jgi:hypothetical protein
MTFATCLRPNRRRYREIAADMEDIQSEIEDAEAKGNFSQVQDLKESLHELQHALFLTGVTSEYDQ